MKKKNPTVGILILMIGIITAVLVINHINEQKRRSAAVIKSTPLMEALGYGSTDFYFPDRKVTMLGRSAFEIIQNDDAVRLYADPKTGEIFYVVGKQGSGPALPAPSLKAKADALVAAVKGEEILKLCLERAEAEGLTGSEYKCYLDGISFSVADVELYADGSVRLAVFRDTELPSYRDNLSEAEALAAAKKEAERFLKKKGLTDCRLNEDSVKAGKALVNGKVVWRCELEYLGKDVSIPYYFDIQVSPKNGKIIENANNLS